MRRQKPKPLVTKKPLPPEELALLQRCLETPWDDAPILIYADWAQDNDEDERAGFIRDSVASGEATHLPPPAVDEWQEYYLPDHEWIYIRGLPVCLAESGLETLRQALDVEFFPDVDEDEILKNALGADLAKVARKIRVARNTGWPVALSLFQSLPVESPFGNDGMAMLAEMPEMAFVGALRLNNLDFGESGLAALADSPHVNNLWYLRLADARPGSVEAEILETSPNLRRLRVIDSPDSEDTADEEEWRE